MNTFEKTEELLDGQSRPTVDVIEQARIAADEGHPYLFSVVVAVYNAEEFVEETIESVVAQSIGFDHIQLVLVNDGSTDGSAEICKCYASRYPGNVVFVDKPNGGVSSARNAGIAHATGKYLNFLDSDDLWSPESLEWALDFFSAHPDVKLAASKYVNFGRVEGDHRLNYKFAETQVIDLLEHYDYPQLSSSTCFFLASLFENRSYNEQLKVSEDVLLVNEILLDELRYGVMAEPLYLYRQRDDRGSAIDTMKDNVSWYLDTPRLCYRALFDLSREKHGSVLPFVQYTIMYDLQWRVRAKMSDVMQPDQIVQYRKLLVDLLQDIDDYIITEQKTISIERVAYTFSLKYGTSVNDMLDHLSDDGGILSCDINRNDGQPIHVKLRPLSALSNAIVVERVEYDPGTLSAIGFVNTFRFRPDNLDLRAVVNNKPMKPSLFITDERKPTNPFNDDIVGKTGFRLDIALPPGGEVRVTMTLSILGAEERACSFRFDGDESVPAEVEVGAYAITPTTLVQVNSSDALILRCFVEPLDETALAEERERYESHWSELKALHKE